MTREEIKKVLPVIQAFTEGKVIQTKNGDETWITIGKETDLNIESLAEYPDCFRIKPEPQYRPFKDADECWQEMLKHEPFGWVVIIENNLSIKYNIQALVQDGVKSTAVLTDDVMSEKFPFEGVLQKFTFVDGTPFGIKKEEV